MTQLRKDVRDFHGRFGIPIRHTPGIPDAETVKLRLRLIAEEFFELLEAAGASLPYRIEAFVDDVIADSRGNVDLPEFADALGDLDYVIEGARLAFGINGDPIAAAIHNANMAKEGGGKRADGKITKPAGWAPPDIEGELRKQGWEL